MTNLQRTKKAQEEKGRMCGIVERFVSNFAAHRKCPGIRSDLYNLFDLLSCSPKDGIIGVQACGADVQAHYRKITIEQREKALFWLASTGKIELWGWRLLVEKRGSKRRKWQPRVISITESDLMSEPCREAA